MSTIKVDTLNTRTGSGNITFSRPITGLSGSGASLTALNATELTSGTLPMARLSGTLPALNGSALTALNATQLTSGTLPIARIADDAVTTAKIAPDAITAAKIADDVINSEHYAAGSIDLEHMSSESVDEDNLHISNAGTNGQFLSKQSGNTGGLTWADAGVSGITDNSNAVAITIDSDEKVGIGITNPGSYEANSSHLVVGTASSHSGITIVGGTSHTSRLNFADGTSGNTEYRGYVRYRHNNDDLTLGSSGADQMLIDSSGRVTMPNQPTFMANAGGNTYNITGSGGTHTVSWAYPRYDIGSNHSGTTFTAPITGKYLICASVHVANATGSGTLTAMGSNIVTSNRTYGNYYYSSSIDNGTTRTIKNTAVADMDAGDTAVVTTRVAGLSSDVVDLENGSGYDYFTVTLLV